MELEEIQNIELEILDDIVKVCEENNIEYFLDWGTLLGAVRHNGFIPWDDDIDISMSRSEYKKFRKFYKNRNYTLEDPEIIKEYPYLVPKVIDKRYRIKEEEFSHLNYTCGLYVDIFIIDGISNNKIKQFFDKKIIYFMYALYRIYYSKKLNIFLSLYRKLINIQKLKIKIMNFFEKYDISNSEAIIESLDFKFRYCVKSELYKEHSTILFKSRKLRTVKDYDNLLKFYYGEYLKMPPIDQRVSNHNFKFINE